MNDDMLELAAVIFFSITVVGILAWFLKTESLIALGMLLFYIFMLWAIPKYIRWRY